MSADLDKLNARLESTSFEKVEQEFREDDYTISRARESTRRDIALRLVWLLALTILICLGTLVVVLLRGGEQTEKVATVLEITLSPLVTLVASAIGF